jgi:hypothetical protein
VTLGWPSNRWSSARRDERRRAESLGMRRSLIALMIACLAFPASALGAPKMTRLGEDPALDGPPALDVTYLDVARNGKDLEIRIGVANMLPAIGGYPQLPGIQWAFTTGKRTFVAEAYVDNTEPAFVLFEIIGDSFELMGDISGTYDFNDGYISLLAPLKQIDARKGTVVRGAGENDVDAHVHPGTNYADVMTTESSYRIP